MKASATDGERHLEPFGPQRGHGTVGDPAGHDVPEHGQVTLDIEGDAVQRAPHARATDRTVRTPMAAILRGAAPSAPIHTPG